MPYIVNFTDSQNKVPITVYDNTSNTDTSLVFPGRNVTGYGKTVAENFLALLENFAGPNQPVNPIEGQLWFDTGSRSLLIYDGVQWRSASDVQKSVSAPNVEESKVGELWVDTVNQQLYVFSGVDWILVGPNFSSGTQSGPLVQSIIDTENNSQTVLSFYVDDSPLAIVSKNSFTPKNSITGFTTIKTGVNLTTNSTIGTGGFGPKFWGTATAADALQVGNNVVESGRFMRTDTTNTTEFGINIRNNSGMTIGVDGTFALSNSTTSAKIYNGSEGSSIDLQLNTDGLPATVLRVIDGKVGILNLAPTEALDVSGNIKTSGQVIVTNNTATTNLNNGSIRTAGGLAVTKNVLIGQTLDVQGTTTVRNLEPAQNEFYELGSATRKWKTLHVDTVIAETVEGVLGGDISGNAVTATSLQNITSFNITGDVTSTAPVQFNGTTGGYTKTFTTLLSSSIISGKLEPTPNRSRADDFLLVFRSSTSGLLKQSRDVFVGDLGVPIGTIFPYAGSIAPFGYLLCDGSELERVRYGNLYDVIGTTYNGSAPLTGVNTFRLPDLRGRFALGRDNMDNGGTVPNTLGTYIDAGGGVAGRVPGTEPQNIGQSGGSSTTTLTVNNLPQHSHNMVGTAGEQYHAVKLDTGVPTDFGAFLDAGPTAAGRFNYLPNSGNVNVPTGTTLNQAFSVVNPFLTLNYIIRSGPPAF
jgi:microcystin-dependent protein